MVKHIETRGSHRDIGAAHGHEAATEIQISLDNYAWLFKDFAGIDWRQARYTAEMFKAAVEHTSPELLDEMAGIAEAANVDPLDILVLNSRSEIALTHFQPAQSDGCSALAQRHPDTKEQWLAQNWDWKHEAGDTLILLSAAPDDKPAFHMVTEAGIIGKIGFNDQGVGVCLNALRSSICRPKLPIHVMLRRVLESDSVEHALDMIDDLGVASPAHFLIADGAGHAAGMEVSPMGDSATAPRSGNLFHTNHLIAKHLPPGLEDAPHEESFTRLARLKAISEGVSPSFESLRERLSDQQNAPDAICRSENPNMPESERMETLFTIIMNLSDKKARVSFGKPCDVSETVELGF
ncbi:C45 family autoproteolytic acyltransferase/hydolase [Phytohalomonas tamaricis]|uniref:C45 family autoproteolytic acyltransferase/hydolase n=1 Tax=Phytohalomonas tamaricis TaxID=2081032 RepID=UPI0021D4857F|nr:C45 family peptidase [Phytohalomonas tamaricis]